MPDDSGFQPVPCSVSRAARHGLKTRATNDRTLLLFISFSFVLKSRVWAEDWHFKRQLLPILAEKVPAILKSQDEKTGRFGTGVFIVRDQEPIYALAVAWATKGDGNPYYHSDELLTAIIKGGDALIAEQKPNGMWIFRKKDNSEWGDIYMPWTYSRWIRAFALVRNGMPSDARHRWEKALTLGYSGILKTQLVKPIENITAHDAMGLYLAGKTLDHPDWCDTAKSYMKKVVDAQYPDGYWTEHVGPVMTYGFVYVEAVGTYTACRTIPMSFRRFSVRRNSIPRSSIPMGGRSKPSMNEMRMKPPPSSPTSGL